MREDTLKLHITVQWLCSAGLNQTLRYEVVCSEASQLPKYLSARRLYIPKGGLHAQRHQEPLRPGLLPDVVLSILPIPLVYRPRPRPGPT
jgi:hypothetical protein